MVPKQKIAKNFYKNLCEDGNDEKLKEKLVSLTGPKANANFVVELMQSNSGKPYLRIFDTVFLP